ncbi:ABC transporter ATP-binding protein [Vibrio sp. SCSIO 43136]|uniref:ABC transporter ATP-binding protein n=1 Tax=Vibrio sp. SCSIO 43136 TaxID=2819101 RepID=UPI002075B2C7|nr:ABC transporter ATP-binding protein [Vibrio sp. SCSIO 43136]USD64283.1 ABC transporter ATP-binding protein [Vibrio sp. SCSIO 43136]
MTKPILEVTDLSVSYDRSSQVLKQIEFSLQRGEILAVVGESGSGKSTLIRTIINLLGKGAKIDTGSVRFDGQDLFQQSPRQWRSLRGGRIAMVFQNPGATLSPMVSIERQFVEAIRNHKAISKQEAKKLAIEEIAKLGLPDPEAILKSRPWQLSGGMKQRVAIAISLAMQPELILADEPTSALDVSTQELVLNELRQRKEQHDTAVIMVSHNLAACAAIADKVLVMKSGQVVDFGTLDQIHSRQSDCYTCELLDAVPRLKPSSKAV